MNLPALLRSYGTWLGACAAVGRRLPGEGCCSGRLVDMEDEGPRGRGMRVLCVVAAALVMLLAAGGVMTVGMMVVARVEVVELVAGVALAAWLATPMVAWWLHRSRPQSRWRQAAVVVAPGLLLASPMWWAAGVIMCVVGVEVVAVRRGAC